MHRAIYQNLIQKLFIVFVSVCITALFAVTATAQEETVPASQSDLTGIALPRGGSRVVPSSVPAEIGAALGKLVEAGEGRVKQGDQEVLAWTDGFRQSQAAALVSQVTGNLKTAGWTYEVGGENQGVTVFSAIRTTPSRRAVVGFYTSSDEALVIAWTELLANDGQAVRGDTTAATQPVSGASNGASTVLNMEKNAKFINVMGREMPAMPKFPALSPKPGKVRGYVKDAGGKPLAGAAIGVRSTLIGGAYSGAQGKTDANGYYEFAVPSGVAHYYNAGYAIDYGDGLAALGLHPADGAVDSFASTDGAVENFVLLSYGVTSRENLQENPHLAATYYGGSLYVGHWVIEQSDAANRPNDIVENSTVEITLTPVGQLTDGSTGRTITVRKIAASFQSGFYIHNIPVGRYKIGARLGGKPLKMKLNRPTGTMFGISPAETTGEAELLFYPGDAKASMVPANYGGWNAVEIIVERPR